MKRRDFQRLGLSFLASGMLAGVSTSYAQQAEDVAKGIGGFKFVLSQRSMQHGMLANKWDTKRCIEFANSFDTCEAMELSAFLLEFESKLLGDKVSSDGLVRSVMQAIGKVDPTTVKRVTVDSEDMCCYQTSNDEPVRLTDRTLAWIRTAAELKAPEISMMVDTQGPVETQRDIAVKALHKAVEACDQYGNYRPTILIETTRGLAKGGRWLDSVITNVETRVDAGRVKALVNPAKLQYVTKNFMRDLEPVKIAEKSRIGGWVVEVDFSLSDQGQLPRNGELRDRAAPANEAGIVTETKTRMPAPNEILGTLLEKGRVPKDRNFLVETPTVRYMGHGDVTTAVNSTLVALADLSRTRQDAPEKAPVQ